MHGQARVSGEFRKEFGFGGPIHNPAENLAGDFAINDFQGVGANIVEFEFGGQAFEHLDEPPGHHGGFVSEAFQGGNGGAGARGEGDVGGDFGNDAFVKAGEGTHPLP